MKHMFFAVLTLLFLTGPMFAADDVVTAVSGTVKKVDEGARTVSVETAKGAVHTFHFTEKATVHGAKDVAKSPDEAFKGLKEGDRVAVHYTVKGGKETAHEVDVLGSDSFKVTKGAVTEIDRGGKVMAIKTTDGAKETFHLTDRAAIDSGKGIAKGSETSAKVTVYYTEDAGKKIAHFFE